MTDGRSEQHSAFEPVTRFVDQGIEALHPSHFAVTMATGIVSIACQRLGLGLFAELLFWISVPSYLLVWLATLVRLTMHRSAFLRDVQSHARGPGFFTSVPATGVLGVQFLVLRNDPFVATGLWFLAVLLWLLCTYGIFTALSVREEKPALADGINGGWLLAVVATQAVCVLGCGILPRDFVDRNTAAFLLASCWLAGGMLYIWIISLIFYRYTFCRFLPSDLMPPYWINMGAVAISTLAGTSLLSDLGDTALMTSIAPFVKGFTILYWATATWWIPMLVALGIWRYIVRRVRFAYDPLYWGLVFPLGMYATCTFRLVEVFDLPALLWLARGFVVVALIAWLLTFFGLMSRFVYVLVLSTRCAARSLPLTERAGARETLIGDQAS
ncbi:tellurite resistance/C4-dicarboxylate transporter family protein [Candidatus Binatia bacterium]|nr:tellurite resistance/C4-dicarboxylate transporter family protein [Candidatus Binatia bacterium]